MPLRARRDGGQRPNTISCNSLYSNCVPSFILSDVSCCNQQLSRHRFSMTLNDVGLLAFGSMSDGTGPYDAM